MIKEHFKFGERFIFVTGSFFHELHVGSLVVQVRKRKKNLEDPAYANILPRFKIWQDPFWK